MAIANVDYTLVVRADGTQLMSDPSGTGGVVVQPVTNFAITGKTSSSISLGWDKVTAGHSGFEIQKMRDTTGMWEAAISLNATIRIYTFTGLNSNTAYSFRIRAVDSSGNGSTWSTASGRTEEAIVIPPPSTELPSFINRTKTVSANATGTGTGTDGSPWTLAQAMANCQPGDIIGVRAGVYVGNGTNSSYLPAFQPARSGTADKPIVFVAEYKAALSTTLASQFSDIRSGVPVVKNGCPAIGTYQKSYCKFIGFYSNSNDSDNKVNVEGAPFTAWDSDYIEFHYCKAIGDIPDIAAAGTNQSGVRIQGTDYAVVANCKFTDYIGITNSAGVLSYRARWMTIEHCEMENCRNGAQLKGGFGNGVGYGGFIGLKFRYNYSHGGGGMLIRLHSTVALTASDYHHIYCNLCVNSFLFDQTSSSTGANSGDGSDVFYGVHFYNNVSSRTSSSDGHCQFSVRPYFAAPVARQSSSFNNIFVGTSNRVISAYSELVNEIQYLFGYSSNRSIFNSVTTHVSGSGGNLTFAQWQAQGKDLNSLNATDPLLDSNFRPAGGSPAIGLGRDLFGTFGPANGVVDAGCYPTGSEIIGIVE